MPEETNALPAGYSLHRYQIDGVLGAGGRRNDGDTGERSSGEAERAGHRVSEIGHAAS